MKDKIFRIFSSSIRVKIRGKNVNNFIKKIIRGRINVIRVIPISYKEIDIVIDYNDLDKVYKNKGIYDIEVIRYYGKLNVIRLLRKNVFVISFLILGIIVIYVLSNIIFNIDIIHSNSGIIKIIESELHRYGIKEYGFVKSYDEIEKIEDSILDNNRDSLEWIEITRVGTKYVVRVEERIINKDIDDNKKYDIVAGKNAVIKYVIADHGEKIKEANSYVRKGDTVISSFVTLPNGDKVQSSASGRVVGEVWYTIDTEYPYYYNEILYTGNKKRVMVFNFINKRISLFDFDKYKSFDKNIKYIFVNNFIPISLAYEYQYETNVINEVYTYDEAKEMAIELAKEKLLDKYKSIIDINKVIVVSEEDMASKIRVSLFVSCDEDITEYREVIIDQDMYME